MDFKPPSPLFNNSNPADNWVMWKQKFQIYLVASGKNAQSEEVKIAILLCCIGDEGLDIFNNFTEDQKSSTEKIIKAFDEYFIPKKVVAMESFKFHTMIQSEDQSIDQYLTDLKKQAKLCDFVCVKDCKESYEERMIRDRLIVGIHNKEVQLRLLREPDLTIKKIIDYCKSVELSKQHVKVLNGEEEVNFVRRTRKFKCKKCLYEHYPDKCPAADRECNICKKLGHFSKACFFRQKDDFKNKKYPSGEERSNPKQPVETVQNDRKVRSIEQGNWIEQEDEENSEEHRLFVNACNSKNFVSWYENISVEGLQVKFKLDSGSDISIIPANLYKKISQILERVQPDRVTLTKPEEDRRRRTIIVEKKNGSYGFTLQSYGIHYKKEQEIEMITYVDYVDYDGSAYRAGMREGDVILSINGTDMEKADHKTLVNFIKSCDSRMRMVVLFEDCVRKVELHIRYIQLQRTLQSKMVELEKLCTQERQLIEGKWRTHSLPARKKCSQQTSPGEQESLTQTPYSYCRTTVSTEDVAKLPEKQRNSSLILAYRYLDPHYGYILQPTASSSEYLLTFDDGKSMNEHPLLVKTPSETPVTKQNKGNQTKFCGEKEKKNTCHMYSGNLCNSCVQAPNNSDNVSLDAYDLASPCCNPHCVPSNRRRSKHHKDSVKRRDSKSEETQCDLPPQSQRPPRSRPHSQASQVSPSSQMFYVPRKNFHMGQGLVSQCSLHSFTSSEHSAVAPTTTGESSGSYTTSLSTDTLYWNGSCDINPSRNSNGKFKYEYQKYPQHNEPVYVQYNIVKPKSWDSLETKAFGGYGFGGYGYIDSVAKNKAGSTRSNSSKKSQGTQCVRVEKTNSSSAPTPQYTPHTQRRYFNTNRSTESLLSYQKYGDSNNSCESLNPLSPGVENRFFQSPQRNSIATDDPNTYYSAKNPTFKQVSTSSEATRL